MDPVHSTCPVQHRTAFSRNRNISKNANGRITNPTERGCDPKSTGSHPSDFAFTHFQRTKKLALVTNKRKKN